jgi:hypothetical protein
MKKVKPLKSAKETQVFLSINSTFKTSLSSFFKKEGFELSEDHVSDISNAISSLSDYREENKCLNPELYITTNIKSIHSKISPGRIIRISESHFKKEEISLVLKKCALLSIHGWCIFIELNDNIVTCGLIRTMETPVKEPLSHILISDDQYHDCPLVRISQTEKNIVTLQDSQNRKLQIDFTGNRSSFSSVENDVKNITRDICYDITDSNIKKNTDVFFRKVFSQLRHHAIGTLVIVVKNIGDNKRLKRKFNDGTWLIDNIDISGIINEFCVHNDLYSSDLLNSLISVILGMMSSDGITIIDTQARILAYNVFFTSNKKTCNANENIIGGARKRTFSYLSEELNDSIVGCYFQSHDGYSEYKSSRCL